MNNQKVILSGVISTYPDIVSIKNGKKLFRVYIDVTRKSKRCDRLPIVFSENSIASKLLKEVECNNEDIVGLPISIIGEIRSYDSMENGIHRLNNVILALNMKREIRLDIDFNTVKVDAYIAKLFEIRETPLGRTIIDAILAIPRDNQTDYVPAIFWNENANLIKERYKVGNKVSLIGRLQSREYRKVLKRDDGENDIVNERIRYELSVMKINKE